MAQIPNEEINKIQQSANIVEIIGSYLNLEKKGKNYFGICPFHDDHTPSMSVSEEKKMFSCFVCHTSGNVFQFIQEYEGVSFIEAVKIVASKVGIELDAGYKETSRYDKHYEAVELANKFYQNNLKSADGVAASKYLKERGISEEIIETFEIGFAPKSYDIITKLLTSKGFDEQILLDTGLANQGNNLYDLFRNRITFPIHNPQGKVVGFSARIYENIDEAKYINTRETNIFKKGKILFNYHRAAQEARRQKYLVVVEGQMDAIRVYSSGIKNVVATMGTALTTDHIQLLKKLNVKIVLCMDNDAAGEKATLANGEALTNAGIDISVLRLNGAKDPDEYILKNGIDGYKDAITNATTYFDFKVNYYKRDKNLTKQEDIAKYINQIINELNKTNDEILRNLMINNLSNEYGIDKNILLNKLIKIEPVNIVKEQAEKKAKISKNEKYIRLLLYYMMNDIKYIKLYEQELGYIPNEKYEEIANDTLAFYLKYNYISIAEFITYEIETGNYEEVMSIIDEHYGLELVDNDFVGLTDKIKKWVDEAKIIKLKEQLKQVTDINEQIKISNEIAQIKKRMVKDEES